MAPRAATPRNRLPRRIGRTPAAWQLMERVSGQRFSMQRQLSTVGATPAESPRRPQSPTMTSSPAAKP